jgi:hypothetical protein
VSVTAEVIRDIPSGHKELTNTFFFTFAAGKYEHQPALAVKRLLPRTYAEGMQYLQGKRRKDHALEFKRTQLREFRNLTLCPPSS